MHVVSGAMLDRWTALSDEEVVSRVLDGQTALYDAVDFTEEENQAVEREPSRNPEHEAFAGELRSLLESSIDDLPDGLREVFMLREVDGLSTADAAACLGVSEDVI